MSKGFSGKAKRLLSLFIATAMFAEMLPAASIAAEDTAEKYPYTMFAASAKEGAITVDAGNFCVNGAVAANGTIVSNGNMNINGTKKENANESMIYIFEKIDSAYFSGSNVNEYTGDYALNEININITVPTTIDGETTLIGNININTALKALEDIRLFGEVKNTDDSVIFSKYGDIIIDSTNVNLNGLIYAPFGNVEISAQNLNLNNVVIIAQSISIECPNVNANYSDSAGELVGATSELLYIPVDEWQYMEDSNANGLPDFFEDYSNWGKMLDTDGEGLPDSIEDFILTDKNETDTDGDGLSDYYELFMTFTDPVLYDSDENGVNDGDEDFDGDGLSNKEEFLLGTDPCSKDSDMDGMDDYTEVYVYHCNPLLADTDGDHLLDGDEPELGFDPLLTDTDGNGILDCNEKVYQEIYMPFNDSEHPEITGVSISADATGNLKSTTTIENTYGIDEMSSGVVGLFGFPVSIETSSVFDTATITFHYNEEYLGDTAAEDLAIMWYDEDNQIYEIYDEETQLDLDAHTISYTTTHFSTYVVVDKNDWYDAWRLTLDYERQTEDATPYYFSFVVDVSGSMAGTRISYARQAITGFLEAMYPTDCANIISFSNSASKLVSFTNNQAELNQAAARLSASGGTNADAGISLALETFGELLLTEQKSENVMILICDGDVTYNEQLVNKACLLKTRICAINVGSTSAHAALKKMAQTTGGSYTYLTNPTALPDVFLQLAGNMQSDTTDADEDGLYDIYEVGGIRIANGTVIYTDVKTADTDGDGVRDGKEITQRTTYSLTIGGKPMSALYFKINSFPDTPDSDNDGYADDIDVRPLRKDVVTYSLKNEEYVPVLHENDEHQENVYYGGNQNWFKESPSIPTRGCGLIAGADALLYLFEGETEKLFGITKTAEMVDKKLRYAYTYEQYNKYIHSVEEKYTLGSNPLSTLFGTLAGIPGFILYTRLNRCFEDVQSAHKAVFYSLQFKEMTDTAKKYYNNLIVESIKEDKPVLLLIGSKNITFYGEDYKAHTYPYHWVTVKDICMDYYTGDAFYTIISWGDKYTLTADEFFDNIGLFSGMILFD